MQPRLTVLLPRLSGWIPQLTAEVRYPALEILLARADSGPPLAKQLDPLRLKLFGLDSVAEVPVAALGRLAVGRVFSGQSAYCLRMDPVILQADLNRVVLMHSGFGGFPADYQQQVRQIVEQTLAAPDTAATAFTLETDDQGWTLILNKDPGVSFTSLDETLGADISDCLPEGIAGRFWKRLQNEIQMALHANAVNQSRREMGEAVINSVWFWGGGKLPESPLARSFDTVLSADPVSSGLARLTGSKLKPLEDLTVVGGGFAGNESDRTLVDWAIPLANAQDAVWACTPDKLEAFAVTAQAWLKRHGGLLEIHSPEKCWQLQARQLWRFWRRPKPLVEQLRAHLQPVASEP